VTQKCAGIIVGYSSYIQYMSSIVILTPLDDFCVVPVLHSVSDIATLITAAEGGRVYCYKSLLPVSGQN
jgi:hypothetical protein